MRIRKSSGAAFSHACGVSLPRTTTFPAAAALLEKLTGQNAPRCITGALKALRRVGGFEIAADPKAALAHLKKGRDLHPELFDLVSRLSKLQNETGDRRAAIETLESFLAVARNSGEIEKARAQLAKLREL